MQHRQHTYILVFQQRRMSGCQPLYCTMIIRSETCEYKKPGEAKLVEKLLTTEEKLLQLKSECNKQQSSVSALRKETENLEKDLSRLRFELQKMEEIRRETEKWRIQ